MDYGITQGIICMKTPRSKEGIGKGFCLWVSGDAERMPTDEEWEQLLAQELDPFAGDDMPTGDRRPLGSDHMIHPASLEEDASSEKVSASVD